ncbi:MAG TPA: hypothetical protein VK923_06275 [Euzebyales bacterium]|nr:hypothetical protein [Euzebyales bacterium]
MQLRELLIAVERPARGLDELALVEGATEAARSLEHSVMRRLAAMTRPARAIAHAAAVEDCVPLHLAAALAEVDLPAAADGADELARADVLQVGDPLRFIHPLVRAAVHGGMPERDQRGNARARGAVAG